MKPKFPLLLLIVTPLLSLSVLSQTFISERNEPGAFPIVTFSQATSIYVDENDDWLTNKAA